jgi:hypothetical protein
MTETPDRPPLMSRVRRFVWGPRSLRSDSAMAGLSTIGSIEAANFTPTATPPIEPAVELDPAETPWELRDED